MRVKTEHWGRRYRVPFNKHKYQDLSDTARPATRIFRGKSAEDAGHVLRHIREATDVVGVRTARGGRYYIGMIHWKSIEPA